MALKRDVFYQVGRRWGDSSINCKLPSTNAQATPTPGSGYLEKSSCQRKAAEKGGATSLEHAYLLSSTPPPPDHTPRAMGEDPPQQHSAGSEEWEEKQSTNFFHGFIFQL